MNLFDDLRYVLGSRSPRRLELLQQIVPAEAIEVVPPRSSEEAGFDGLGDWPAPAAGSHRLDRMAAVHPGILHDHVEEQVLRAEEQVGRDPRVMKPGRGPLEPEEADFVRALMGLAASVVANALSPKESVADVNIQAQRRACNMA